MGRNQLGTAGINRRGSRGSPMRDDQLPQAEPVGSTRLGASVGRRRRRRGLWIVAWTVAGVVLVGAAGAGYLYYRLNGNINSVDIDSALGRDRPAPLGN